MRPEYLEDLANRADPLELWRLSAFQQKELPPEQRQQLDAGVALRRHAAHVRRLNALLGKGQSLLITPLSANGTASEVVPAPAKWRDRVAAEAVPAGLSDAQTGIVRFDLPAEDCFTNDTGPYPMYHCMDCKASEYGTTKVEHKPGCRVAAALAASAPGAKSVT